MELKKYQQGVLSDLKNYLAHLSEKRNYIHAYNLHWEDKGFRVGIGAVPVYRDIVPNVPDVCFKIPTGGGKTFQACCSIKPIFEHLPISKIKAVVWLVPSDAILEQTLWALRTPAHPYRQRLDVDFSSRVEVYTKEQLLSGQNFNITTVSEQLSVMVLSYDSFRGRKEALKSRQENSALAPMAKALGTPENPVEGADETALLQIINQLNPLVIVDESHHARSTLSKEMLESFNPCFVLDLTATPTAESNIISYVDALQLKRENMVKLPVIVYNRNSVTEVINSVIDIRTLLEELAGQADEYIRPIALLQAQPNRGRDVAETYENLREKLIQLGIPREQIAVKTANVNEIHNVNLLCPRCPIRYIITVNALKEGWDCPFAYVLASIANKSSAVDVEQIVGRILRQPYCRQFKIPQLNYSYVLTCSNEFQKTLQGIVKGLNNAGFSGKEFRAEDESGILVGGEDDSEPEQMPLPLPPSDEENAGQNDEAGDDGSGMDEFMNINPDDVHKGDEGKESAEELMKKAAEVGADYQDKVDKQDEDENHIPTDLQDMTIGYPMYPQFEEEARSIRIPQFFKKSLHGSLFHPNGEDILLEKESLLEGFNLKRCSTAINWEGTDSEMVEVDVRSESDEGEPKVYRMQQADQLYLQEQLQKRSPEGRIKLCKTAICASVNKRNVLEDSDIRRFVDRVIEDMTAEQITALQRMPRAFAGKIDDYIEQQMQDFAQNEFNTLLAQGNIVCKPSYILPKTINPLNATTAYPRSLYKAEQTGNPLEQRFMLDLSSMDNIKWWHRNISRLGLCLNGYINHYPDFILCTHSGKIILVETKGDHLDGVESRQKAELGNRWADKAGDQFFYFMVFENKQSDIPLARTYDNFLPILRGME